MAYRDDRHKESEPEIPTGMEVLGKRLKAQLWASDQLSTLERVKTGNGNDALRSLLREILDSSELDLVVVSRSEHIRVLSVEQTLTTKLKNAEKELNDIRDKLELVEESETELGLLDETNTLSSGTTIKVWLVRIIIFVLIILLAKHYLHS